MKSVQEVMHARNCLKIYPKADNYISQTSQKIHPSNVLYANIELPNSFYGLKIVEGIIPTKIFYKMDWQEVQ